jgi:hypothetical protein
MTTTARRLALPALMVSLAASAAAAQTPDSAAGRLELRITSGGLHPTGRQRAALDDAKLTAAQLSWLVRPSLAVTGTVGWARSRDLASVDTPKLDVFTSDLGLEARPVRWFATSAVTVSPFVGVGAGMRSYDSRAHGIGATNNVAAYAAAGGTLGIRRVALRLEVRDYASGYKPLAGIGRTTARNDVVIMAALGFTRRHAAQD